MVEAAIVLPLLVIIIVLIIKCGVSRQTDVETESILHVYENQKLMEDDLTNTEDVLRARRMVR